MTLAAPAWAEREGYHEHHGDRADRPRYGGEHERYERPRHGHGRPGPVIFVEPPVFYAIPGPSLFEYGKSFRPPSQFRYYCNHPAGYFPAVSACAGRWLESGAVP